MQLFQQINDKQREGVAKVCDNFATICSATLVAGGFVDHKLAVWQALALVLRLIVFLAAALQLREDEGGTDD